MIPTIRALHSHGDWAMERWFRSLASLPEGDFLLDDGGGSLRDKLVHIVWAEALWIARIDVAVRPSMPEAKGTAPEPIHQAWDENRPALRAILDRLDDVECDRELHFVNSSGHPQHDTVAEALTHIAVHGDYHRGQMATIMRRHGWKPPYTDLIGWYRELRDRDQPHR